MHQVIGFDAILVLDLVAGGLGWRLGDELGIPTFGWAFGGDVRVTPSSFRARALRRTLERLDVVFYQSRELMGKAAALMQITPDQMLRERHVVLPHGIPRPPVAGCDETRKRVREAWKISDDQIVVLSVGRITREKGIYEILEAISRAAARDPKVTGVVVGSMPAFDETAAVQDLLKRAPELGRHVRLYPACEPDQVWEYLCAADIFAFASRREGMPNSLLEAMAMGVPAVAFAIPAIEDLDAGQSSLLTVPLGDVKSFAEAILGLAASPEKRASLGKRGLARVMDGFMVEKNMRIALEHMAKVLERRQSTKRGGTSSALPPS
jgi:glycosyltransferase involved in cell wall biosynthesis